ncbi:uncharacterized protein STEHIDRAFT_125272 [Stereum hirsutum FP-91666 SS1]|uniref:uncharacterized protein n=1 Tax=Stereum hirsutum (strain FP-91666) TaxID=721885 RepID=UPI0004449CCF|nr:uncharacterized protein STEHIDRAFT_125272 [Stereum hirsutum FP-91666 SS1]EIM80950.1 hypothetical protein STEHIDRAFT_125272 [Stereum hirsutum FP-91666 SS1]
MHDLPLRRPPNRPTSSPATLRLSPPLPSSIPTYISTPFWLRRLLHRIPTKRMITNADPNPSSSHTRTVERS